MRWCFFFLFLVQTLRADVSIDVQYDKKPIEIDETVQVAVTLLYPEIDAPNLFPFFYRLLKEPYPTFKLVNFKVLDDKHFTLDLQPTHTGKLIFAPGPITFGTKQYLFPPISIECVPASVSTLPLAGLLTLFPEKRIDLSIANRAKILSEEQMLRIQAQNQKAYERYSFARSFLAIVVTALAFSLIVLWLLIYYEVLWRNLRPKKAKISPLQRALKELQASSSAFRWQELAFIIREALGRKEAKNFHVLSLFELAEYVQASTMLKEGEKADLLPMLTTLGAISYAGKKVDEGVWQSMRKKVVSLARSVL